MKPVEFPGVNVCERPTRIRSVTSNESSKRPAGAYNYQMAVIPGRIEADTGNRDNSFIRTNV